MRTLQLKINEVDLLKYNLQNVEVYFSDLVDLIKSELANNALSECVKISEIVGFSSMTLDEINNEIKATRNAQNNS